MKQEPALEEHSPMAAATSKTAVYAAIAGNLAVAVTKFIAAFVTGSSAMLSEGFPWTVAYKELRETRGRRNLWTAVRASKDPTTFTVFVEDSAAMLGLLVAFLGVYFGRRFHNPYLDGAASIVIGVILGAVAV